MTELLLRAAHAVAWLAACAALIALASTTSAWVRDLREQPSGGHGSGRMAVGTAAAVLGLSLAAILALRRAGSAR